MRFELAVMLKGTAEAVMVVVSVVVVSVKSSVGVGFWGWRGMWAVVRVKRARRRVVVLPLVYLLGGCVWRVMCTYVEGSIFGMLGLRLGQVGGLERWR